MSCYISLIVIAAYGPTERCFFTAFVCLWADGPWVCSQRLVIAVLCAIGVLCFRLYWRAGVSPAQCLTGSSTFLHQRQWESLQKRISVNRQVTFGWRQTACLPKGLWGSILPHLPTICGRVSGSCLLEQESLQFPNLLGNSVHFLAHF